MPMVVKGEEKERRNETSKSKPVAPADGVALRQRDNNMPIDEMHLLLQLGSHP
jgi:hypothetical protein